MNPIILILAVGIGYFVTKKESNDEQRTHGDGNRSTRDDHSDRASESGTGSDRERRVTQPKLKKEDDHVRNELQRNSNDVSRGVGDDLRSEHHTTEGDHQSEGVTTESSDSEETDNDTEESSNDVSRNDGSHVRGESASGP